MAEFILVIAILVLLVVAVVVFKILHSILKLFILFLTVGSIAFGVGAFLVVMDANEFMQSLGEENNLFLIAEDNEVISGIAFAGEESHLINQQQLEEYSENLQTGDYESIKEGYYKVIILDSAIAEDETNFDNELANRLSEEVYAEQKAALFIPILQKTFSDPVFLLIEYKKGNIIIYEETAAFKAIKYVPVSMVKFAADKIIKKTETAIANNKLLPLP